MSDQRLSESQLKAVDWRCPAIACPHCDGLGMIALALPYWETLRVLVAAGGPMSTDQFEGNPTTVVTRLSRLEKMGLVKRAGKNGKVIVWVETLNEYGGAANG